MLQDSISADSETDPGVLPSSLMLARVPPFFRTSGSLGSSHSMVGPAGQTKPGSVSELLMSPGRHTKIVQKLTFARRTRSHLYCKWLTIREASQPPASAAALGMFPFYQRPIKYACMSTGSNLKAVLDFRYGSRGTHLKTLVSGL